MRQFINVLVFILALTIVGCSTQPPRPSALICKPSDTVLRKKANCDAKTLAGELRGQYESEMEKGIKRILSNYNPPKYDGGKYKGEITICLNEGGGIESSVLTKASGHHELDEAMLEAANKTLYVIDIPKNECLDSKFYLKQFVLSFDQNDMQQ